MSPPNDWLSSEKTGKIPQPSCRPGHHRHNKNTKKTMKKADFAVFVTAALVCAFAANPSRAQLGPERSGTDGSEPEFNLMGFGDISYISKEGSDTDGFAIGQAVAHLSASLGHSFGVFGEFSMTARNSEYSAEVERFIVKYEFSDLLKFSAGRYHTPIGYWNSAFHHGAWLQTTTSRPEMVKFGSRIVPIHFVGALLEGHLPRNALGLSYMAGIGNGRHADIARAGDAGDINGDSAWMFQINTSPSKYYGLKAGVGYYQDVVSPTGQPDVDEQTVSAYIAWAKEAPEVIIEYLYSTHDLASDSAISGNVEAWYAQFAWRLPGKRKEWKPYVRYERNRIDDSDPLLGGQGLDYDGGIFGVRWDFNPFAALKGEYRNEEFAGGGRENNFRLQVSFVLTKL
jgi:hypothetical protein